MKRLSAVLLSVTLLFAVAATAADSYFSTSSHDLLSSAAALKNDGGGDVVFLLEDRTFEIDAQNRVNMNVHRIFRIDTQDAVEHWAAVSASWSPWYQEKPVIHARVVTSDGVEHVLDQKTLVEGPLSEDSPNVYNDGRVLHGPLPAVAIGAVVEEEYVIKDREPMFAAGVGREIDFGSFWGPVEKTKVTLRAPQSVPLKYVSRLLPNLQPEKQQTGEMVEYRFEQGRMDMLEQADPGLPGEVARQPYVYFSTGASWAEIASAYHGITEAKIRTGDVEELVKKTDRPNQSREETIRQLYILLHKRVRYTGVEFGEASLVPATAAETLKRGYGDCKDKALLLTTMLRTANIPAYLALVDEGNDEDIEADYPAMDFNHAIVYVPGTPDMWIDATANGYRVGPIPQGDAGRYALIVRPGTSGLVRIPQDAPKDNLLVEKREFDLAEFGPAHVVETSYPSGATEASYRSDYESTDNKQTRDSLEDYVKGVYTADKLGAVTHSDAADLNKPFELRIEAEKCRRGFTNNETAEIAILPSGIYSRLPAYLKGQDKETKQDTKTEKPKKQRTSDYVFMPFITEWQYRVVPPMGFRARTLPENKTEALGPAKLSYSYKTDADGAILATLTFDSVKGRYTPEETEAIRKAIIQFEQRDAILIGFDNIGHALLAGGKIPEALKQYDDMAARHPKEALHRSQVARAMLDVGLCESARREARLAIDLEPKSAQAFSSLAWILEHDLVCRRFKGNFDRAGAIDAYRKAIELDPTDVYQRINLAILLENGSDGLQYSPTSQLDAAIVEWKQLRQLDKETFRGYENNLLFDLMYAGHFEELESELAAASSDNTHRAMLVAATAALKGQDAAIEEASRIAQNDETRSTSLSNAAQFLIHMRRYPMAAALLTAAAKGSSNSAALLQQAAIDARTTIQDPEKLAADDPRTPVMKTIFYGVGENNPEKMMQIMSPSSWQGETKEEVLDTLSNDLSLGSARAQLAKLGVPVSVLCDIVVSNLKLSMEGDDATGYRISMQAFGAKNQTMYVVKENGKYYLLGASSSLGELGYLALQHLKTNNLEGTRKVLDWARTDFSVAGGDDPLAGTAFPHLWNRGDQPDPVRMKNAVLSMLATRKDARQWVPEIIAAHEHATTDNDRTYLLDALLEAYNSDQDWKGMRETALEELKLFPRSNSALRVLGVACGQLHDWETWSTAINARLAIVADDPSVLREQARFYAMQSKFAEANTVLKKLIDGAMGTANDMNGYAWNALLMHNVTPEAIEQARRAMSIQKDYAIEHTLASLYADDGNPLEARQLLLEIMENYSLPQPDDSLWYVFGRIAEDYKQPQAATACYKRVRWKQKFPPGPEDTYTLVAQRLSALGSGAGVVEAK